VARGGNASVRPRELPLDDPGDEAATGRRGEDAAVEGTALLARVLEAGNRRRARHQVRRNQGAPGLEGRTVGALGDYLQTHWPTIRAALREGPSAPQPVRRPVIPKAGGGTRHLGIPTGLDRCIAHALLPVLQEEWDATFSERSDGFRPQRHAHQAVAQAQADLRKGSTGVVDLDREPFFDRVNHDVLMRRVRRRVKDRRVVPLIHRCLKAGVVPLEGSVAPTAAGTPPGGPRSPRLANLLLDEFDKERETRGPRFVRDADEAHLYVRRRQAGARVMARVTRLLKRPRRLTVRETKSAVDRPWNRTVLGVTFTTRQSHRRKVREQALQAFNAKVRAIPGRTRGRTIRPLGPELRQLRLGWRAFFGVAEVRSPRRDLAPWARRRRRSDHWQQGGRRGDRERRKRGVGRHLAWTTVKSAPGSWRLSQSPALARPPPA
jgi:RNA-directed DNA polymerase